MKYIFIFFLLFIILISIYLGNLDILTDASPERSVGKNELCGNKVEAKLSNLTEQSTKESLQNYKENFTSFCPDDWEKGKNDSNGTFHCIVPNISYPFDPTSITGCCLWLDANDYEPTTNGTPSIWKDKSSNKYSFQSYINGSPPNINSFTNGKQCITFDSSKKNAFSIYKPTNFNIPNKSFSLFVVCKFKNDKRGAVISKWERQNTITRPSGVFIGNEYGKLYATIVDTEGKSKPPHSPITDKLVILSLMGNLDSTGKFYINGVKQPEEFNSSSKENIFINDFSIVIGGSADNTGYTMKDVSDCQYKDVPYEVSKEVAVIKSKEIIVETENATYTTNENYDIYTFTKNGSIKFKCDDNRIVNINALAVGGGGGGGYSRGAMEGSGGGGAGMISINDRGFQTNTVYDITVGGGGKSGENGSNTFSNAANIMAYGGGRGGNGQGGSNSNGVAVEQIGSGGGGQGWGRPHIGGIVTNSMYNTSSGGIGNWQAGGGGGGGAKTLGETTQRGQSNGGKGGDGLEWWITGETYGAGGYGGEPFNSKGKSPTSNGGNIRQNGESGKNPGDGGGGGGAYSSNGGSGQNGVFKIAINKNKLSYEYTEIEIHHEIKVRQELDCNFPPKTVPTLFDENMFFDGDIAEIIAYSNGTDISDEVRNQIETYLAVKWDLINLPEFSNNKLISEKISKINIGKKDSGYIGYNSNENNFLNANGTPLSLNPVWNNEVNTNTKNPTEKYYQIDFNSPNWSTTNKLENACIWAKNNNIYWDKILLDCKEKYNIDLLTH